MQNVETMQCLIPNIPGKPVVKRDPKKPKKQRRASSRQTDIRFSKIPETFISSYKTNIGKTLNTYAGIILKNVRMGTSHVISSTTVIRLNFGFIKVAYIFSYRNQTHFRYQNIELDSGEFYLINSWNYENGIKLVKKLVNIIQLDKPLLYKYYHKENSAIIDVATTNEETIELMKQKYYFFAPPRTFIFNIQEPLISNLDKKPEQLVSMPMALTRVYPKPKKVHEQKQLIIKKQPIRHVQLPSPRPQQRLQYVQLQTSQPRTRPQQRLQYIQPQTLQPHTQHPSYISEPTIEFPSDSEDDSKISKYQTTSKLVYVHKQPRYVTEKTYSSKKVYNVQEHSDHGTKKSQLIYYTERTKIIKKQY